ncbi:MAG: hypothetical protein ACI37Z_05105 [Candidatus Gastranaerophilaceae bacterium]
MTMVFRIGDRVKVVKPYLGKEEVFGKIGTVIYFSQSGAVAVEFDDYIAGNDGLGNGKWGFCWIFHSNVLDYLELLKDINFEIGGYCKHYRFNRYIYVCP